MIAKKTKKLFYNKYLYKVSLSIPGIRILRSYNVSDLISSKNIDNLGGSIYYLRYARINKKEIQNICKLLHGQDEDHGQRIEGNILDLYTNDKKFFDRLKKEFSNSIRTYSEPDVNEIEALNEPNLILCNKLPHNKYQIKVFLKPHLIKSMDEKENILNWLESQKPKVTLTNSVRMWFKHCCLNWDRRYILVEDEKTLLMLKLRSSEIVGKTYRYKLA